MSAKETTDDPWPENRVRLEATFEGAAMLDKPTTDPRFTMDIYHDGEAVRFEFRDRGVVRLTGQAANLTVMHEMFERFKLMREKVAVYG